MFGPETRDIRWLELAWWRVLHVFGQHTWIEAHNVTLDDDNMVKRITTRIECAICEVPM